MTDITSLSILEMRDSLKRGDFTALELAKIYINRIKKSDLNAFITFDEEYVLKKAKESDERIKSGTDREFEGIPIGVKDLFCTKDIKTTAASKLLEGFIPPYESTVTQKLFDAGFYMIGKTNCDEFAMGGANIYSYFGDVKNPWDKNRIPGGSSGGSAAAVAAGLCPVALGSDTGGSCRQPAGHTGTVGLRTSHGRISRYGIVSFAPSFDQAGVMARNVEDASVIFEIIAGYDEKDPTSSNYPIAKISEELKDLKFDSYKRKIRIGVPAELDGLDADKSVLKNWNSCIDILKESGWTVETVSIPNLENAIDVYKILAFSEGYSSLARYGGVHYGLREKGETVREIYQNTRMHFQEEVRRRLLIGAYMLSSKNYDEFYVKALKMRQRIIDQFNNAFKQCDIILTPSTSTIATLFDDIKTPGQLYIQDILTSPVSVAGICALAIPTSVCKEGAPLGVQVISNRFDEETMFKTSYMLEKTFNFGPTYFQRGNDE